MFDFARFLSERYEWSLATFGAGRRTNSVLAHIAKECEEIRRAPLDLEEWVDVIQLALDGAARAGHSPEQVVEALVAKHEKNKKRRWIVPADEDAPVEHIR